MAIERDQRQEEEWKNAQDINLSISLIPATKQHLKFLAAVDRNSSWLCNDCPLQQKAIYRYIACWIPLLAQHTESPLFEGPLVVPLDCEWIWHCHRLNPVQYKSDCEEFYGKILDNKNVVSSTQGVPGTETENVWNKLFPSEPFVLDPNGVMNDNNEEKLTKDGKFTTYDLTSAVQRQSTFFSQIDEPHMSNDLYLEGAVARYKGFLHIIKRNMEMDVVNNFLAPTYDIDLIWHTHQLHSVPYYNDCINLVGDIVGHDDTVTTRVEGKKLDVGFVKTINGWSDLYGSRYRRAGAMHKFFDPDESSEKKSISSDEEQKVTHLPELKIMEVMMEFVNVKDMPEEHEGKQLFVSFIKTQPDALFMGKRTLPMLSTFEDRVATFKCQPTGKFLFELLACSPSNNEVSLPTQTLGSCFISLEDLLLPESGFMVEKWLELSPSTDCESIKPISLRMAISVTPPTPAPLSLGLIRLAACLCSKACPGSMSSDSETFPCVMASNPGASPCVGNCTKSNPGASPCVGNCTKSNPHASPCVGNCTKSNPRASPCVGNCTKSNPRASPCVGNCTKSNPGASPCVGNCTKSTPRASPCVGNCTKSTPRASPCVGNCTKSTPRASPCVGNCTKSTPRASPCVGNCTKSTPRASPCVGNCTKSTPRASPCVGNCTKSTPRASPCVGNCTKSTPRASPCVGNCTKSTPRTSPCVGNCTKSNANAPDAGPLVPVQGADVISCA